MSLPHAIQRNATGFNGAWLSIRREEVDCHILPSSARSFIKPGESLLAWKTWWNELVEGIKSNRLSPITVRNEIRARLQEIFRPECTIELLPVESKVLTLTSDAFLPTGNPIGSNFSTLLTHLNHFTSLTASAISQGLYDPDGLAAHHVSFRWKQFAYQLAIHCIKERSPSAAEMFNFALHYLGIVETSNLDTWHCFITYYVRLFA
ncbi:unnamed protein product [Dicrocoelium dendriticum]|nr:unnamed protein product [Dicrocoelium dendriticum]